MPPNSPGGFLGPATKRAGPLASARSSTGRHRGGADGWMRDLGEAGSPPRNRRLTAQERMTMSSAAYVKII